MRTISRPPVRGVPQAPRNRTRIVLTALVAVLVSCSSLDPKPSGYDGFQIPGSAAPAKAKKEADRDAFQIKAVEAPEYKPSGEDTFRIRRGPSAFGWVDPSEAIQPPATVDSLIIGSWNIKWFGSKNPDAYDYVTMADFIEECHVVAIQEVQDPNHQTVITNLLTELTNRGHDYEARISDNTGYDSNTDNRKKDYRERYAFIWDKSSLDLKSGPDFVGSPRINHGTYRQVPWVADFKVKGGNGFDFRILSTHTVYNAKINFVRKAEIEAIDDWITTMPADGEENLVAIGDFNANPSGQPSHFASIIKTNELYRILWYESASTGEDSIRTTVPTKDTSSNPDYFRLPLYDHALISSETSYALPADPMTLANQDFGVWKFDDDQWWKANGWTRPDLIGAVSDHRPIWFRISFTAADRD